MCHTPSTVFMNLRKHLKMIKLHENIDVNMSDMHIT